MASYNVQNNPYYVPMRGNNILSDRLLAALQSFGAPASGPAGDKVGFGRALIGDDTNRINTAAMLRQNDIDAGRIPFEAEVGADEAGEKTKFANQQALQAESQGFQKEQFEADRAQRAQLAKQRETFDLGNQAAQLEFQRQQALINEANEQHRLNQQLRFREMEHTTPSGDTTARLGFEANQAQPLGNGAFRLGGAMYYQPKINDLPNPPPQLVPGQMRQVAPIEASWLRDGGAGSQRPAIDVVDQDMQKVNDLIKPLSGLPTNISY